MWVVHPLADASLFVVGGLWFPTFIGHCLTNKCDREISSRASCALIWCVIKVGTALNTLFYFGISIHISLNSGITCTKFHQLQTFSHIWLNTSWCFNVFQVILTKGLFPKSLDTGRNINENRIQGFPSFIHNRILKLVRCWNWDISLFEGEYQQ